MKYYINGFPLTSSNDCEDSMLMMEFTASSKEKQFEQQC